MTFFISVVMGGNNLKRIIVGLLITLFLTDGAWGQETQAKRNTGARRQLATIVFAGLGGAILGLSTLSFYGRPQEQLANIGIGFAVGVIAGTAYVTFRTATTHDYYEERPERGAEKFKWGPIIGKSSVGARFSLDF